MEQNIDKIIIDENVEEVAKYDPEMRFRDLSGLSLKLVFAMTLVLSIFHIYTAGFGVLQEWRHRAFHLAFVLPLVFMFYSIRKENSCQNKHLVYDLVYALIGTSLLSTMLCEILDLSIPQTLGLSLPSFLLILYFKRREFLSDRLSLFVDLPIFTVMVAGLGGLIILGARHIDFGYAFKDLNASLLFWSIFLFASFFALSFLFLMQWLYTVSSAIKRRRWRSRRTSRTR